MIDKPMIDLSNPITINPVQVSLARDNPRDESSSLLSVLALCDRQRFAEEAQYPIIRNRKIVGYGPSIRLAEAFARSWKNILWGSHELQRSSGRSTIYCFAVDLETLTIHERTIIVEHVRDTRGGRYPLESQTDINQLNANYASRASRAMVLSLIPEDLVEKVCETADQTMIKALGKDIKESIMATVKAYHRLGVSETSLSKYLGVDVRSIGAREVLQLNRLGKSIADGFTSVGDIFPDASPPSAIYVNSLGDKALSPTSPGKLRAAVQSEKTAGVTIDEPVEVPNDSTGKSIADIDPREAIPPTAESKASKEEDDQSDRKPFTTNKNGVRIGNIRRAITAFKKKGVDKQQLDSYCGIDIMDINEKQLEKLRDINKQLQANKATVDEVFATNKKEDADGSVKTNDDTSSLTYDYLHGLIETYVRENDCLKLLNVDGMIRQSGAITEAQKDTLKQMFLDQLQYLLQSIEASPAAVKELCNHTNSVDALAVIDQIMAQEQRECSLDDYTEICDIIDGKCDSLNPQSQNPVEASQKS